MGPEAEDSAGVIEHGVERHLSLPGRLELDSMALSVRDAPRQEEGVQDGGVHRGHRCELVLRPGPHERSAGTEEPEGFTVMERVRAIEGKIDPGAEPEEEMPGGTVNWEGKLESGPKLEVVQGSLEVVWSGLREQLKKDLKNELASGDRHHE